MAMLPFSSEKAGDLPQDISVVRWGLSRQHPILSIFPDLVSLISGLWRYKPDIVQSFALHSCVVLALASAFVSVECKIFTITGLGLIDVDTRRRSRLLRLFAYWLLRAAGRGKSACFVFENTADPVRLGFRKGRPERTLTLMSAGVNPAVFAPNAMPTLPPLKLAIVSRMIWSKGTDLAVEAVTRLIARGVPVHLDLYGETDCQNPRHFPVELLQEWGSRPGIRWHGFTPDVPAVWRDHHVGLFPSRGGEGLPRALLEAASCERALIATDVPGCVDFVRPGLEGILVRSNSEEELERAIETFVRQPELLEKMGRAARRRVLENSTEEIVMYQYRRLFSALAGKTHTNDR